MTDFHRIKRLPPYVFEQVNRIKARGAGRRRRHHRPRHGQPGPAGAAARHRQAVETAGKPRTDRYSASKGIAGLRRAQAGYYARRFGVKLNPDTQVVATLGSKEGFANMAQAITGAGRRGAGAEPELPDPRLRLPDGGRRHPLGPGRADRPPSSRRSSGPSTHSIPKPIALVVCYPSNPTAYVASLDFYRDLVAFAKKHELILLSDLAYAEVYFDERAAALGPAGAGRDRRDGRVHLDVEDLLHGRLAHRLRGRQRAPARGARRG